MEWILSGILLICVIVLAIKLSKKQELDTRAKTQYEVYIASLQKQREIIQESIEQNQKQKEIIQEGIEQDQKWFEETQAKHRQELAEQQREINDIYEYNKRHRMEQLENEMLIQKQKSKELLENQLQKEKEQCEHDMCIMEEAYQQTISDYQLRVNKIEEDTKFQEQRFNSLIAPLKQYEMDKQARLFYTIQIPEEYHSDIDYLLNTVSQKIQHPDVINKLIWTEYFKSSMDDMIKRVGIKDESGIYKITNINNGKAYIGKSTNIKKRLQDHVKSSIGIQSIADQMVHHEMLKTGLWNWTFEVITYCDKDQLSELEKYYINFFKTQEFGYNRKEGG